MRKSYPLVALVVAAAIVGVSSGSAQASEDTAASMVGATSAPASQTTTSTVDCVQSDGTTGSCQATMTVDVSAATPASVVQIESDPNLTSAQRSQMTAAAASTVFYYWAFNHKVSSWYGSWAWSEAHSGAYYYNGSKVWLASTYLGYKGWHQCNYGTGFGYSIKVTICGERMRPDLGNNVIAEYDNFEVHAVAKGIPIFDSKSMWVNLYPSGVGYYHWMN